VCVLIAGQNFVGKFEKHSKHLDWIKLMVNKKKSKEERKATMILCD